MNFSKGIILSTILCLMLCVAIVFGQSTSGTISGNMLDPQDNVLPGATVKIRNLGTGAMRKAPSDSSGYYRVTGLAPDRYEVEGAAQWFATETGADLELTVAEEIAVNFNLKVGVDNENVTVEVQSVNVETTGSNIVNETRFGLNRSTPSEMVPTPGPNDPGANISLIAGHSLGEVNVTGLSPASTDRTNPKLFFQNDFQFTDNLIEYEDEDPIIKEIFEAELKKSGVKNRMRPGKGESSD